MQIIQGIRDKGAAIVIAVIALSLIGFILMDAKQGANKLFSSSSSDIGKVNGTSIEQAELIKKVNFQVSQQEQGGRKLSTSEISDIRDQIWQNLVEQKVFFDEANKLGIYLTTKEMNATLSNNSDENPLKQDKTLLDSMGRIDPNQLKTLFAQIKKYGPDERLRFDEQVLNPLKIRSAVNRYTALLNASAYYPAWMEEKDTKENKTFAQVSYVQIPYSKISDSAIKVTDEEVKNYVDKNKQLFKQEEGRMISYVAFSELASKDDSDGIRGSLEKIKNDFVKDSNAKSFLARNSSTQPLNETHIWKSKMQGQYKDTLMHLQKGDVFGPYLDRNNYTLAKLVDVKPQPDSVFCRHILIKIADLKQGQIDRQIRPDSTARRLVDSIAAAIKGGADFNLMVLKYSDDPGSRFSKGEYRFNYNNTLVDSFYRTVFYEPVGTKKIVMGIDNNSYYGYHYIEVLDQYKFEPAYEIAYLSKDIFASDVTINKASFDATKFAAEKDPKRFDTANLKKLGLNKITVNAPIKENDTHVEMLQDARTMVRWAFTAKQGEISEPFNIGDQFIVAIVDKVLKEGTQDVETARPRAEVTIKQEKKADEIMKKLGSNPTIEGAASAYSVKDTTAGADSSLIYSSQSFNKMFEPKLVGAVFNKENQTKGVVSIAGKSGVFIFKVNSVATKAADTPDQLIQKRKQAENLLRTQANNSWFPGIKNQASIKDYRSKFY